MQHLCIKMSKNDASYVKYFVWLCTYLVSNVSSNVQTQMNPNFIQGTGVFHLVACLCSFQTSGDSSENVTECDMSKSLMHTVGVIWSDFISNGGSLALRTAAPVMIPCYFTRHQQTRSFFLLIYALTEMTNRAFEFVGFIFLLFCLPLFITQPLRFI